MIKNNILVLGLVTLLVFASCGKNKLSGENEHEVIPENIVEMRDDQVKLAGIKLGIIELRALSGTLRVAGTVSTAPQNSAMVSIPMGGFVRKILQMPGNAVRKGAVLAVIENPDFVDIQQRYLEVRSKLEYIEADYRRQKELYKSEVASAKNLQLITSEYKSLTIQAKSLEQKLILIGINPGGLNENTIRRTVKLLAPISGYVKSVNVTIGKVVSPTDVLFEIVNTENLFLQLSLFEKDVAKVSVNQRIRFFVNNESELHEAVVYQTSKAIDVDKTFKVYASVKKSCDKILPGMYVNAIIEGASSEVTSVPDEAIVHFDDKDYIFVFEKSKTEDGKKMTEYRMIQIRKGVSDGGYTEVILPVNFNIKQAKLVVKGAYNLLSAKKNAGEMSC